MSMVSYQVINSSVLHYIHYITPYIIICGDKDRTGGGQENLSVYLITADIKAIK